MIFLRGVSHLNISIWYFASNSKNLGGCIALPSHPAALGLNHSISKMFFGGKIIDVAEVNWWPWFKDCGEWLENVDWTHLVLASGNSVPQKTNWLKLIKLDQFWPAQAWIKSHILVAAAFQSRKWILGKIKREDEKKSTNASLKIRKQKSDDELQIFFAPLGPSDEIQSRQRSFGNNLRYVFSNIKRFRLMNVLLLAKELSFD